MDEIDAVPRTRRQRPKDSFQNELQSKLKQRKSFGLSADITDSDDEGMQSPRATDFMKRTTGRPSAAKRRSDASPDLSRGLGTTTMRTRDLSALMGRDVYDDEDEEIKAANLGKTGPGGSWQPGILKTPSPKQDSIYSRKTPTPKDQSGRLESIYGKKTPTRDSSPKSESLSKEDIIFGRKTPVEGKRSPLEGKKSPYDGLRKLPGMDGEKSWQPTNYRSVSPGSSEHSRGSRGVTPVDSALDTISETPREKVTPRMQRGQKTELSPKQLVLDERPKPQTRSRISEGKTPPLVDPRRMSPSAQTQESGLKRASPSMDLFGKGSRVTAAQEVESYIDRDKDKRLRDQKLYGGKSSLLRSPSPESKKQDLKSSGRISPRGQGSGHFAKDGRKTPTERNEFNHGERKTPTGIDRKTPTSFDRKTPTSFDRKTPTSFDRKTPTSFDRKPLASRKNRQDATDEEILQERANSMKGASLLDFLTEGSGTAKPKPQPQARKNKSREDEDWDDLFTANKQILEKSGDLRKSHGRKSPQPPGRRSPELSQKKESVMADTIGSKPRTIPKQFKSEDSSSVCEEIPLDPNRKIKAEAEKAVKSGKQSSETAKTNSAIDAIADAQTMKYIEPAKKIRPVTAHAKVQHRPKPRYGALPGETKTLQERQFNSTGDIRDAIYEEWYSDRLKSARKKKMEEEKRQKEKEEKEKKEKKEKRLDAEASYRCWMEKKGEEIKEKEHKKIRQEKEKQRKEVEDRHEKRVESAKCFGHWKEKKDQMIRSEMRKKEEEERKKKEDEEYEKRMKNKERKTAFEGWQRKKEKEWKSQSHNKNHEYKHKKEKENEEKDKQRQKEEDALDRYYDWVEEKEKQARLEKKRAKQRKMMGEDEFKPAWSPASRTIPFGS